MQVASAGTFMSAISALPTIPSESPGADVPVQLAIRAGSAMEPPTNNTRRKCRRVAPNSFAFTRIASSFVDRPAACRRAQTESTNRPVTSWSNAFEMQLSNATRLVERPSRRARAVDVDLDLDLAAPAARDRSRGVWSRVEQERNLTKVY
jgi:hypothetical protein